MAEKKLKTIVTADTSQFKKGMKKSKAALSDFAKQGESAFSGITSAIGVTSGSLGTLDKNIKNATTLLGDMASKGGQALTGLERGAVALGGAIAGLGIAAAITAFKELNAQAEMFKNTVAGANLELQAQVYRDTFRMAMEDQLGNGASFQKTKNGFKRALTEVASTAGNIFIGSVESMVGSVTDFKGAGDGLLRLGATWNAVLGAANTALDKASAASQYQGQLNKALNERMTKTVEWSRIQREIAEYERTAEDTSLSREERLSAVNEAMRLQDQLGNEQVAISKDILRWTSLISDQATDSVEDTKALLTAQAEADNILAAQNQKMRLLEKMQNRIAKGSGTVKTNTEETAKAEALTLEAATELVKQQRALKALQDQNDKTIAQARFNLDKDIWTLPGLALIPGMPTGATYISVPVKAEPDTESAEAAILELSGIIEDGVNGMSESIGYLISDLINGENAWGNFAQAGISVVADMLATVGKAFVATGVGVVAANKALQFGSGAGAIVAGSAMVALAAAMKGAMSNAAANWSGGYSSSVASSAYTSGAAGPSSFGREMEVKVTGTLIGEGSKLVAVLNNEGTRKSYTT